jgi:hypothetical protein
LLFLKSYLQCRIDNVAFPQAEIQVKKADDGSREGAVMTQYVFKLVVRLAEGEGA